MRKEADLRQATYARVYEGKVVGHGGRLVLPKAEMAGTPQGIGRGLRARDRRACQPRASHNRKVQRVLRRELARERANEIVTRRRTLRRMRLHSCRSSAESVAPHVSRSAQVSC
jgi:hypothetical protein